MFNLSATKRNTVLAVAFALGACKGEETHELDYGKELPMTSVSVTVEGKSTSITGGNPFLGAAGVSLTDAPPVRAGRIKNLGDCIDATVVMASLYKGRTAVGVCLGESESEYYTALFTCKSDAGIETPQNPSGKVMIQCQRLGTNAKKTYDVTDFELR